MKNTFEVPTKVCRGHVISVRVEMNHTRFRVLIFSVDVNSWQKVFNFYEGQFPYLKVRDMALCTP